MLRLVRLLQFGIGPLFEQAPPAGGQPSGNPAPGAPPAGGSGGSGGGAPAGQPPTPPADNHSGFIPRERFDQVNDELRTLKAAEEKRAADEAQRKGDFETLSKTEKAKREAAEQKATTIGRRAAFISKAVGKVTDAEAAYKLAAADGLLNEIEIDDEGDAKDPKKVDAAVEAVLKSYEFLKSAEPRKDFGQPRNGQPGAPPVDTSKMTGRDMLRTGFDQQQASGFRQRS